VHAEVQWLKGLDGFVTPSIPWRPFKSGSAFVVIVSLSFWGRDLG
jgi:hypothetical protein